MPARASIKLESKLPAPEFGLLPNALKKLDDHTGVRDDDNRPAFAVCLGPLHWFSPWFEVVEN